MSNLRTGRALIVDVEMACWKGDPPPGMRNEIIEIGIVEIDTKDLLILREGSYLVRPAKAEISEYCTRLTGIAPEEVKRHGRPLGEVLRTIANEFGPTRKLLLAWGDDWTCFEEDCEALGIDNPFPRHAFTDIGRVGSMLTGGSGRLGLDDARRLLGLGVPPGRHRALPDARATAELCIAAARVARRVRPDLETTLLPSL